MPIDRIRRLATTATLFAFTLAAGPALAAGSNMPWEQPLNQILQSIEGPVAKVLSVIVIIITGLTLAFGETSGGFRRLIQIVFGLSICVRRELLLPVVLPVWRRGARLMEREEEVAGFYAPVHRALIEPILLGGAPRAVAIVNGTLAAAIGLGLRLWLAGGLIWLIGHLAAVWAAKRDPAFVDVVRRHLRYPQHLVA